QAMALTINHMAKRVSWVLVMANADNMVVKKTVPKIKREEGFPDNGAMAVRNNSSGDVPMAWPKGHRAKANEVKNAKTSGMAKAETVKRSSMAKGKRSAKA